MGDFVIKCEKLEKKIRADKAYPNIYDKDLKKKHEKEIKEQAEIILKYKEELKTQ